jgi:hypothetical protein
MRHLIPLGLCLTIAGLGLAVSISQALAGGVRVAGPVIVTEPATVDFGTVTQETIHRTAVTVRNVGSEPLAISRIDSDCGCAVAQLPDSLLAPGDSTVLRITLSTRHFSGHVAKHIMLHTNDPGAPQARITLKAFVRVRIRFEPSAVDFGAVARGQTPAETVLIKSAVSESLKIVEIVVPEETFTSSLEQTTERDSLIYRLRLQLRPDAPVGPFKEKALIRTSHKLARELPLQLEGQIYSFFQIEPREVSLGQVREGKSRRRTLRISGQGNGNHHLLSATSSDERLLVEIRTIEEGHTYEIAVTVPAEMPHGRIKATLRVETDDPAQPEIRIPVRGNVRQARSKE